MMSAVAANDLKTKGIKAIEDALLTQPEASVSVRGQIKYVVMSQEHYHYLRECELEAALAESKADLASDRFVKFLKRNPAIENQYAKALELLEHNPHHPSLRLHALSGRLSGLHSISINLKYRITIELIITEREIILINVGDHDAVY
jgi:mRNA-degrading endonuclease YafQ of YafQ-DinJ toxin-antitoxin module